MDMMAICAAAVVTAVSAAALKKYSPETAAVIGIAGGILIFLYILMNASPFIAEIKTLTESSGLKEEYGTVLLKTVGICAICRFTADCCRDTGQQAAASRVEFAAKLSILLLSLPLFENILTVALSLLEQRA